MEHLNSNIGARRTALKDITKELQSRKEYWKERIYLVGSLVLDTKETRLLNRELGLHKINMHRVNLT